MANNMISKDLGPATAYAIAVENGYTGTEEQWASEIANASNNAQMMQRRMPQVPGVAKLSIATILPTRTMRNTIAVKRLILLKLLPVLRRLQRNLLQLPVLHIT